MRKVAFALAVSGALLVVRPAFAAPQNPQLEVVLAHPAQEAGISLGAAGANLLYFPVRFSVTVVTAVVGGLSGWLTGGNSESSQAIWNSTDGQAYITPAILQGRERLRFGPQQR